MNQKTMTPLKDLTLLHRFLFSEAVEDLQFLEDVLSIIMDEEIILKESEEVGVKYMREWEEKLLAEKEAREEGLAEGRAEGLAEGQDRINKLNEMLLEAGRIDDLKASVKDSEFQTKLLEKFGL